jgi:hypothetical protein
VRDEVGAYHAFRVQSVKKRQAVSGQRGPQWGLQHWQNGHMAAETSRSTPLRLHNWLGWRFEAAHEVQLQWGQ